VHPNETVDLEPALPGTGPLGTTVPGAQTVPGVQIVAAIPARYASVRFPGKPLAPIAGRPMVEHVYRRVAAAAGLARVVVLTDDVRIGRAVDSFGGEWEMTPPECASGTDRIAYAARSWGADAVVNVQGDEPLIDPAAVAAVAAHLAAHPEDSMVTLAAPIPPERAPQDLADPNAVKVVLDRAGYALYFSRAAIPYPRQPGGAAPWKHLGIYGYQRAALLALAELPPSPLEVSESLEQLRALENGLRIRVLPARRGSPSVDTPEDLARVEGLIAGGDAIDTAGDRGASGGR
jgi:3-deoxy-manno-octulosonate cytidylyltransferase (CMP-KDO synthetase)